MLQLHGQKSAVSKGGRAGAADLLSRFLLLPPDTRQQQIQSELAVFYDRGGLPAVMDALYRWELAAGYITPEKLEMNECLRFYDGDYEIDFHVQVNRARSGYTPGPPAGNRQPPVHCAICRENVGRPGKETLRVFEFCLHKSSGRADFFLQLTPFPVFPYHFVVITLEPEPMRVNRQSMGEMLRFAAAAPEYTVCSNSDVRGAGSSILEHHHLQVFKGLTLPVMTAGACEVFEAPGCSVELLHYPLSVLRVRGDAAALRVRSKAAARSIEGTAAVIVENWKKREPGANTVNLIYALEGGTPCFYIIFRNPAHQIPERLKRIKQEGIGILEAAGTGIFPVPSGPEKDDIWAEIRNKGKDVMLDILRGIDPLPAGREAVVKELIP